MWTEWYDRAFEGLPGNDDILFHSLWEKKRLLFDDKHGVGDIIDYHSARLVAAAIRNGERLLIVLPDLQPHRPAFLLAIALIRYFLDLRRSCSLTAHRSGPVLYFGPHVGIREQLRRVSVRGLGHALADVFSQHDMRRGATTISRFESNNGSDIENLPRVITIYSPSNPKEMMQLHSPSWIAVDCSDISSMTWLQPLLKECAERSVPVIAWGQNALSEIINEFKSFGNVFVWPPQSYHRINDHLDLTLSSQDKIFIEPHVLCGNSSEQFSALLRQVRQILVRINQYSEKRVTLGKDTVAIHWKYYRSLESLAVPLEFYESEAPRFWGLQSLGKLTAVCSHFRSAIKQTDPTMNINLEEVNDLLQQAKRMVEIEGCVLWDALVNYCIEDFENGNVRLLIFPSDSKKKIFLFAMLARHNTTEDDLNEMGTHVTSLKELRGWIHNQQINHYSVTPDLHSLPLGNKVWHPILVGMPSPLLTPRLLYVLLHPNVNIILYPHQCPSFICRQAEWSDRLGSNASHNATALSCISKVEKPTFTIPADGRIVIKTPLEIDVQTSWKTRTQLRDSIWKAKDSVIEVDSLFKSDDEYKSEGMILRDRPSNDTITPDDSIEEIWCTESVRVQFDQGWSIYLAIDDMINILNNGRLDRRYVRSLKPDDHVLIIHGQQRQSLYDLIISRVHRHPSIELPLAMIRQWQEDLRVSYGIWRKDSKNSSDLQSYGAHDLDGLLRRMRANGSSLISSVTLYFWLKGFVLCPHDPEDLLRIAEVLNMTFVKRHYRIISQAANRLRGLHRGLSHKLNRWLQEQISGTERRSDDDIIDADLGLTFGDVKNSLLVLRVKCLENIKGPFLRATLGRLEKDERP